MTTLRVVRLQMAALSESRDVYMPLIVSNARISFLNLCSCPPLSRSRDDDYYISLLRFFLYTDITPETKPRDRKATLNLLKLVAVKENLSCAPCSTRSDR